MCVCLTVCVPAFGWQTNYRATRFHAISAPRISGKHFKPISGATFARAEQCEASGWRGERSSKPDVLSTSEHTHAHKHVTNTHTHNRTTSIGRFARILSARRRRLRGSLTAYAARCFLCVCVCVGAEWLMRPSDAMSARLYLESIIEMTSTHAVAECSRLSGAAHGQAIISGRKRVLH